MGDALTKLIAAASGAIVLTIALVACGGSKSSPERLADETTRAVYAGDLQGTTANFDDSLKGQVTRAQVGAISDAMHMLGSYKGLKLLQGNSDSGRYDFSANFDKGTMLVMMRVDPNGKIDAYRVSPTQQ